MKVSGFTFVRNAVKFDYPVVESITSILPVCDEVVVAVGNSEDETLALIESIDSPKIKIIHSVWDDSLREGGKVLAVETNKAFAAVSPDSDWAFYIQADEVVHEKYLDTIQKQMQYYLDDKEVEGLLFKYLHFYGNYNYVGNSRDWYRREIRIVRNDKKISSYRDAQGFRKEGDKLKVKLIDAYIYHYGWVKSPYHQKQKEKTFHRYWHDDNWMEEMIAKGELFDYSNIDLLSTFGETHPQAMQERINRLNWDFTYDPTRRKPKLKKQILHLIEKYTGKRLFEYRNYKLI
jgi:glycosyltransferase involved in cell wall biosynthesis